LVVNAINRRIAAVADKPAGNGEPLLVLRYQPGGEYRAHSDTLAHVDNQRVATMLLYLNDDYQGGETEFPLAGVKHRGRSGDALFFSNVDNKGQPLRRALHAGLPVAAARNGWRPAGSAKTLYVSRSETRSGNLSSGLVERTRSAGSSVGLTTLRTWLGLAALTRRGCSIGERT
jgi:hypothetical protein